MPFEPLQVAAAGVIGFASAGALRWWQYRRDLWIGQVERFTDTLLEAADCATEYWITPVQSDEGSAPPLERRRAEAKLSGLQARLDGFLAAFQDRLSQADIDDLHDHMGRFTDALTGGAFQSHHPQEDPERALLAQTVASDLLIATHAAANRALTVRGFWRAKWDWSQRIQAAASNEVR